MSTPYQEQLLEWHTTGQLALVGWTLTALGILVYAVQQGLMGRMLGYGDLTVTGTGVGAPATSCRRCP